MHRPLANVHCHFMNSSHVPDEYAKKLAFEVSCLRLPEAIVKIFKSSIRSRDFWFKDGTIDNYINKGYYKKGNIKKGILKYDLLVPLMMDMVTASCVELEDGNIEYKNPNELAFKEARGVTPFEVQISEYSFITANYPWRIFPFINFNPYKPKGLEQCKKAIGQMGFVGIKMYPAHGFYADPFKYLIEPDCPKNIDLFDDDNLSKFKPVGQNLIKFFRWANELSLPINVHSQYQSMQNINLSDDDAYQFNAPKHWENVLKQFSNIRVNFAHFGGSSYSKECEDDKLLCQIGEECENFDKATNTCLKCNDTDEKFSLESVSQILAFAEEYNGSENRIFADISVHSESHFIRHLKSILDSESKIKLMFGTDTPVIAKDKDFYNKYNKVIKHKDYKDFYWDNTLEFLFGKDRTIPESYITFLENYYGKSGEKLNEYTEKPDLIEYTDNKQYRY